MYSVVIPTYNMEKTIKDAIDSVLNQTKPELVEEIIIVDDGSTDKTEILIKSIQASNPIISIQYLKQKNAGVSNARNNGIKFAHGEWIALLDADDIWLPHKIERQYNVIKAHPNLLFLGSHYPLKILIKNNNGLIKLNAKQLCIRSMPSSASVVFKKAVALEMGLFNEKIQYGEDINFFQKFLLKDNYFVLAEKLVELNNGKKFFAEKGLSSSFEKMYEGKRKNMIELYNYGLIKKHYLYLMIFLCYVKHARRSIKRLIEKNKNRFEESAK